MTNITMNIAGIDGMKTSYVAHALARCIKQKGYSVEVVSARSSRELNAWRRRTHKQVVVFDNHPYVATAVRQNRKNTLFTGIEIDATLVMTCHMFTFAEHNQDLNMDKATQLMQRQKDMHIKMYGCAELQHVDTSGDMGLLKAVCAARDLFEGLL